MSCPHVHVSGRLFKVRNCTAPNNWFSAAGADALLGLVQANEQGKALVRPNVGKPHRYVSCFKENKWIYQIIIDFLEKRKSGKVASCDSCNSSCCNGPGFAILENVIEIYKLYSEGLLKRDDFTFDSGLNLSQFVYKYFDRAILNGKLLVFFPKMLSENNRLITVPPWNYWNARDYIKNLLGAYF